MDPRKRKTKPLKKVFGLTKVCVMGLWHLGTVYAACLADLGYQVVGVDKDPLRIESLSRGIPPLYEPGLSDLIQNGLNKKSLTFSVDLSSALKDASFLFITFDTKVDDNDDVDLTEVYDAAVSSALSLEPDSVVVISSQVPVGTCEKIKRLIQKKNPILRFEVAYVPENLRLGKAISIFMKPERIVIGANDESTLARVEQFFAPISDPKLKMNLRTAEMTKHALNAFLATSVSFGNEIGNICDIVGADALRVSEALRMDSRIGSKAMLKPGLAFAGGTLARDIKVLKKIGAESHYEPKLINGVFEVNKAQNKMVVTKIQSVYDSLKNLTVTVFGLTYKAGTSTLRRSASIEIITDLTNQGAKVKVYDPKADLRELKTKINFDFYSDPFEAVTDSDAIIFVTDWPEFKELDFRKLKSLMKKPVVIDAQNVLPSDRLIQEGFVYLGIGRGQAIVGASE